MDRLRREEARTGPEPDHAHLVGIAGRGLPGLAQVLVQRGLRVTGSEPGPGPDVDRLRLLGARVHAGHGTAPALRSARWLLRPCRPVIAASAKLALLGKLTNLLEGG